MDDKAETIWEYIGGCLVILIGTLMVVFVVGLLILGIVTVWGKVLGL